MKYKAFAKAVELKSLSGAAEALGCSESELSNVLRSFEEELGFPLLIAQGDAVTPTQHSLRILPYCQQIADAQQQLTNEATSIVSQISDVVRIGTPNSMLIGFVSDLVARFTKTCDVSYLSIHEDTLPNVRQQLADGSLDVAFITQEFAGDMDFRPLFEDEIFLAVNKENPLAENEALMPHDLKDVPIIYSPPGWDDITRIVLSKLPFKPNLTFSSTSDVAALAMVKSDRGVYVVSGLQRSLLPDNVVMLPFHVHYSRTVGIAARSMKALSQTQRGFLDMSIEEFA